jgi:hypothetical protein
LGGGRLAYGPEAAPKHQAEIAPKDQEYGHECTHMYRNIEKTVVIPGILKDVGPVPDALSC